MPWTRLALKTSSDKLTSFPFSAFWRLVCSRVIFSKRKSFYVFIAFYISTRSFVKEKVLCLLFGISFAFWSSYTEICFSLDLCSSSDTTEVPSSNCDNRRFARMWYRSHGIHRFSNLFMMSGETLSLHEYSRLLVLRFRAQWTGTFRVETLRLVQGENGWRREDFLAIRPSQTVATEKNRRKVTRRGKGY